MSDIKFKASLDTGNIDKKLSDAAKSVDKLGAEAKKASASFDGLKKALLGITAAAAGLTAIAKSAATMGRETANLARVAGISAKQFQGLAYAAQQYGIEQDKLGDIFKDVNDKVGDFLLTGAGPMADFFEQIAPRVGVTAEQFRGLSGDQALGLYIDTLEKAGVSQAQMTFMMEALASDSSLLFDLYRNGGAEVNRLSAEFDRLGLSINTTKLSSLANDFQLFGQVFKALAGRIGEALAPVFRALAEAIKASLEPGGKLRAVLDGLSQVGEYLSENMEALGKITQRVASYFVAFAAVMAGRFAAAVGVAAVKAVMALAVSFRALRGALISTGIGALVVALGEAINYMINLSNEVGGLKNAFMVLGKRIGIAFQGAWVVAKEGWASFLLALQNGFNWIKRQITEAFTFDIELPQWYKDLTGASDISVKGPQFEESTFAQGAIDSANAASASYQQALADFNAWKQGLIDANREGITVTPPTEPPVSTDTTDTAAGITGRGLDRMGEKVQTLKDKLNEWRKSMGDSAQQMSDLITGTYAKMEDALVNFVMTGKVNFADLMRSMAADLIRFSIRTAAFNIFTKMFGPVPSKMGNAFGASGQLNFANGGVFNQKFAMPMGDGRMAIGAEAGPEAIMPLQRDASGRLGVIASGGNRGSGGAQIINQFNTTVNPPPNSKPEDARNFAREFNKAVEAKVVETMSRVANVGVGGRR